MLLCNFSVPFIPAIPAEIMCSKNTKLALSRGGAAGILCIIELIRIARIVFIGQYPRGAGVGMCV